MDAGSNGVGGDPSEERGAYDLKEGIWEKGRFFSPHFHSQSPIPYPILYLVFLKHSV